MSHELNIDLSSKTLFIEFQASTSILATGGKGGTCCGYSITDLKSTFPVFGQTNQLS